MKKIYVFRIMAALIVVVLALAAAGPAFADEPERSVVELDNTQPVPNPCGFAIMSHVTGTIITNQWTDPNGDITQRVISSAPNIKGIWSANGKTIDLKLAGPTHYYITSSNQRVVLLLGPNNFIIIPGTGHVYGWAGRISITIDLKTHTILSMTVSGNGDLMYADWEALCAYLGP